MVTKTLIVVNSLAELQAQTGAADTVALITGKVTRGDGQGGFYWWDPVSVEAESLSYMLVIAVTGVATGRWKRINAKVQVLPHGILVLNGGVKTFYASGVTDANGQFALNLTMDNMPGGPQIFSEIWFNSAQSAANNETPNSATKSYVKTQTLSQTVYAFFRSNVVTMVVALLYSPVLAAPAGVVVFAKVEGV